MHNVVVMSIFCLPARPGDASDQSKPDFASLAGNAFRSNSPSVQSCMNSGITTHNVFLLPSDALRERRLLRSRTALLGYRKNHLTS